MPDLAQLGDADLLDMLSELPLIEPSKPGAQDTKAMDRRVARMDVLYHLAKRHKSETPMHHTYTGLHLDAA